MNEIAMFHDPEAPVQANQYQHEFQELLNLYCYYRPRRVLEIGVHRGGSLYQWIKHARTGALIVAVDLPGARGGDEGSADPMLWQSWAEAKGVRLVTVLADSHDRQVVRQIRFFEPFNWIFIDGDHSYYGVRADYFNYGNCIERGYPIIFHDILPHAEMKWVEVHRFWQELKETLKWEGRWRIEEFTSGPEQMEKGIGVIYGKK